MLSSRCLPLLYEERVLIVVLELQIIGILSIINIADIQPVGRYVSVAQLVHVERHAGLSWLDLIPGQRVRVVAYRAAQTIEIDAIARQSRRDHVDTVGIDAEPHQQRALLLAPVEALVTGYHALLPIWCQAHGPAISLAGWHGVLVGRAVILPDVHAWLC